MACKYCTQFFARFRCNAPDECDCPRCQGMCECATVIVDDGADDSPPPLPELQLQLHTPAPRRGPCKLQRRR